MLAKESVLRARLGMTSGSPPIKGDTDIFLPYGVQRLSKYPQISDLLIDMSFQQRDCALEQPEPNLADWALWSHQSLDPHF